MNDFYQTLLSWVHDPCGKAEQLQGRASRKRERIHRLLNAYWQLAVACEPIIEPYSNHPILVINRFWATCDFVAILTNECYPDKIDFFNWFCDSDTIAQERVKNDNYQTVH